MDPNPGRNVTMVKYNDDIQSVLSTVASNGLVPAAAHSTVKIDVGADFAEDDNS